MGGLEASLVVLYSVMSCLCSAIWWRWSTSFVLRVDGNGQEFLGTMKGLEPVEKVVCSVSLRIMPMCLWSPPFVVGMVASIAPSSRVSWFMSSLVGCPSILVMLNFLRLSLMFCLIPMVEVKNSFAVEGLIATARQQQKISCNDQVVIN